MRSGENVKNRKRKEGKCIRNRKKDKKGICKRGNDKALGARGVNITKGKKYSF